MLTYKKYYGSIEFSLEDSILFGEIQSIDDVILYEGQTLKEPGVSFEEAVEDYLITCEKTGKSPEKSLSDSLNIRIGQNNHKELYKEAMDKGIN